MAAGAGFGQVRDAFSETLDLVGEASLGLGFDLTKEQKDKIQALRVQAKTAQAIWEKEHADELKKLAEQVRAAGQGAATGQFRDMVQKRQDIMATAPNADSAAAKLKAILTAEQLKTVNAYAVAKQASDAQMGQQGGGMFGGGPGRGVGGGPGGAPRPGGAQPPNGAPDRARASGNPVAAKN